MNYIVGTRGSRLALRQTQLVIDRLQEAYPEDAFEVQVIRTTGDKDKTNPIDKIGSKGVFVDTIEEALLSGEIHLAVHSMKDMPDTTREGLTFAKAWKREDPRDVCVLREAESVAALPKGARIGTGSKRRACQLLKIRPDLEIIPIRGNVDTRIRKLYEADDEGMLLDGVVLAAAGLIRLGRECEITCYLSEEEMIPAPAQGILALEVAKENRELLDKLNELADEETEIAAMLERGFLKQVGANCHDTIGAYACRKGEEYVLRVIYGDETGGEAMTAVLFGNADDALIDNAVEAVR